MFKKIGFALLLLGSIAACKKDVIQQNPVMHITPAPLQIPPGFAPPYLPADNPQTKEGIYLGRRLFYEKRLSGDNTMSCGTCHMQELNFAEPKPFSVGIDGSVGNKNAMILSNMAWGSFFFWDGRRNTLEEQIIDPIENPIEMKSSWPDVIAKLRADPFYVKKFEEAFGPNAITKENASKAIAQFIRTMVSGNSKYDQGKFNNFANFTPLELDGKDLYMSEKGDCFHCHGDTNTGGIFGAYGKLQFSNNGLDSLLVINSGRESVTGDTVDRAKFKIPSLRNVEYSFPYMHDGRFLTLRDVIDFYNTGGHVTPTTDPLMKKAGEGRNWSEYQKSALIAFLRTLSDVDFLNDTTLSDPW